MEDVTNYKEWLRWRWEYFKMRGKESDIFGGVQWTKEQQYKEEINSLLAQIYNTVESHRKLSRKEKKTLKHDIATLEYALTTYNK